MLDYAFFLIVNKYTFSFTFVGLLSHLPWKSNYQPLPTNNQQEGVMCKHYRSIYNA